MSLSWLFGCICFLFYVTTDAYWHILIRFGFWHTCTPNFLSFTLSAMPARGAAGLKLASEKPLLVVSVFSDFPTGISLWVLHS